MNIKNLTFFLNFKNVLNNNQKKMKLLLKILSTFLIFFYTSSQYLKKNTLVIGIVTLDVQKKLNLKKTTYMFTSYTKWLEENNLEWIPISIYDTKKSVYKKLKKINGVFLTGGTQDLIDENGLSTNYKKVLEIIVNYAKQKNNKGTVFPILATCLGFESLINILTSNHLKLKRASNENETKKVYLSKEAFKSNLNLIFSYKELRDFSKEPLFYYHHSYGYEKKDVEENPFFKANLRALGFNTDDNNKEILAIFEHKKYPFIGWQFHPEKIQFEHNDNFIINRDRKAVEINSRFSSIFHRFLRYESPEVNYNDILEFRKNMYVKFGYDGNDESYFFPYNEITQGSME